ncbi:MAG: hypothetical protein U0452_08750 [Anaerolineae bacterium]
MLKRLALVLAVIAVLSAMAVLPAFAGTTTITGTLTATGLLPNGKPNSCPGSALDNYPPLYSQLRQIQVTATGAYDYRDVGYLDDSDTYGTIDIEISLYTGTPAGFDPANPTGNGCFFTADDTGTVNLQAGVTYTLMITSNDDDPNTGYYIFSLKGPGDVVIIETSPDACPLPLPAGSAVYEVPAGAPAFYDADLGTQVNFNLPAGHWWISEFDGDFARVWIGCQANPIWIPTNAVAR